MPGGKNVSKNIKELEDANKSKPPAEKRSHKQIRASSQYFDGRIDEVGVWKRLLTSTERAQLWNSSVGRTYPFPGT